MSGERRPVLLKAGIFLDVENLMRNGGWGIRYDAVTSMVEEQGAVALRANAYMAIDVLREARDGVYRQKKDAYRGAIRRNGYHLVLKQVMRYRDEDGAEVVKANADLDLAVDAMLQSENLDYILLGTGDGDFVRLVRALQARGKRVDVLSFANTSSELRETADRYICGFLVPGLVRTDSETSRLRGIMHGVDEDRGFGFLTVRVGLAPHELREDVFLHISDFTRNGAGVSNAEFAQLKNQGAVIELEIETQPDGRPRARNVVELTWNGMPIRI
jgi:uncharacterized LabA/DUF88 family protein/cold shock CspA family protein